MVIRPVVSEILRGEGVTTPQMPIHCQKQQMLLTVNVYPLSGRFEKNINAIVAHILKSQTDRSYVPTYSSISLALSQTL